MPFESQMLMIDPAPAGYFSGSAHWLWSSEGVWGGNTDGRPVQVRWFSRTLSWQPGWTVRLALSADTRYLLYVNGVIVARGPQKGDVAHQFYDVLDLTENLRNGENLLSVRVDGQSHAFPYFPYNGPSASEMSDACLFATDGAVCDATGVVRESLASDARWWVTMDRSLNFQSDPVGSYVGFTERCDLTVLPDRFFLVPPSPAGGWEPATMVHQAVRPDTALDPFLPHRLMPRSIAPLTAIPRGFAAIRAGTGALSGGAFVVSIAARTTVTVILDAGVVATAWPRLRWQGGQAAEVVIAYAECFKFAGRKEHRDRIDGEFVGYRDRVVLSRALHEWQPLHWRAFRYIELTIQTRDEALQITSLDALTCAYPLTEAQPFRCSDPQLEKIWEVGLRTQRACAHDTFEDCPYYEQLQYAGDAQMQINLVYSVFGEQRLPRQAIRFFHWSRLPEGITQSRYPSRPTQVIPSWSLHYVLMLSDWWWQTGDAVAIREEARAAVEVLRWFFDRRDASGLVGALPYWCVADWSPEWVAQYGGNIPGVKDGPSALINCQVIAAAEALAEVLTVLGEDASLLRRTAIELRGLVRATFWDAERGLLRDCPGLPVASQLTNAWALLLDLPHPNERGPLAQRLCDDRSLCQTAFFGDFWLFEAWRRAGRVDLVRQRFAPYLTLLNQGVTTWPEDPSQGRSDCHAWSNAATFHLVRSILGIVAKAPAWTQVAITPQMVGLTHVSGGVWTARGRLNVAITGRSLSLDIPPGTVVELEWNGKKSTHATGIHHVG